MLTLYIDLESKVSAAAETLLFQGSRIYELAARRLPPLKSIWVNPLDSHIAEREEDTDPGMSTVLDMSSQS